MRHRRCGREVWEAFHQGVALPIAPRPIIDRAWRYAKTLGVDPACGAEIMPLGSDELSYRRAQSPLSTTYPWVLDELRHLGEDAGQLMVVADHHGIVLWRGGDRAVMRKADQAGFVDGARWDFASAGNGGISLALLTRHPITVCRTEHYVESQHGLSCAAIPVHDPRSGRVLCVLNLTGRQATFHPAMLRALDTIALRLKVQLSTLPGPGDRCIADEIWVLPTE